MRQAPATARIVLDEVREVTDQAGPRLPRVELELDLRPFPHRLEAVHLDRDQLRLALLLVVDAALDHEDPVGDQSSRAWA